MKNYSAQTQTQTCDLAIRPAELNWTVAEPLYTYADILGDLKDDYARDYARDYAAMKPAEIQAPEIEADEFEAVYLWFLS